MDGRDVWHWHHSLSGVLGNDRGLQETDRDRNTKVEICMLSEIIFKIMLYQILIELYNFIRHSYCLLGWYLCGSFYFTKGNRLCLFLNEIEIEFEFAKNIIPYLDGAAQFNPYILADQLTDRRVARIKGFIQLNRKIQFTRYKWKIDGKIDEKKMHLSAEACDVYLLNGDCFWKEEREKLLISGKNWLLYGGICRNMQEYESMIPCYLSGML